MAEFALAACDKFEIGFASDHFALAMRWGLEETQLTNAIPKGQGSIQKIDLDVESILKGRHVQLE